MRADTHPDDTPVFLYDEKGQLGPMPLKKAHELWENRSVTENGFYWMEGMPDWQLLTRLWGRPDGIVAFVNLSQRPLSLTPVSIPSKKSGRVLIVDDDLLMREMIGDLLDQEQIPWEKADDIQQARLFLEENGLENVDAVITDYQTPEGSGIDLVRWIKQREKALQIILLSAKDDKEVVKSGLRAGVLDFLEKPLRSRILIPAIKAAIEKTRNQRDERSAYLDRMQDKLAVRGEAVGSLVADIIHRESNIGGLPAKVETVIKYSDELERINPALADIPIHEAVMPFQGQIADLSLLDLIQLLSQSGKTGELQILAPNKSLVGSLYLYKGSLVHATRGKSEARTALALMIEQKDGYFCFHYGRQIAERSLFEDTVSLLLSLSAEMDKKTKSMAA